MKLFHKRGGGVNQISYLLFKTIYVLGNAVKMRQEIHNSSLILSTKVKVIISRETHFRKVAKAAALKI